MDTFLLQDPITIGQDASMITQSAVGWLELPEHEDVVFFVHATEVNGTVTMSLETAPSPEDSAFVPMTSFALAATGVHVEKVLCATAAVPLARFVRWKLTGSGVWTATFRVWLTALAYE